MAVKPGDHVKIIEREVTADDRRTHRYYDHMAGLTGVVVNVYSDNEVSIKIDPSTMRDPASTVHDEATRRMRAKFLEEASEAAKSGLTQAELNFGTNYMLLAQARDLVKL